MPSKSKSQQRLFCMALAVRKGDLARSKVSKSVLDIVDSDMTNKQIEDFTVLKENRMKSVYDYIQESILSSTNSGKQAVAEKWLEENNIKKSDYEIRNGKLYIQNNGYCVNIKKSIPSFVNIHYIKNISFSNMKSFDNMPVEMNNCEIKNCEIDDFLFINQKSMMNNFSVHDCKIKSLRGLPECTESLVVSNNEQHYSLSEIAKYSPRTNKKKIHNFGYTTFLGNTILGFNDKKYIDDQFQEFVKTVKSEVKELRGNIFGRLTRNNFYVMTFNYLPLSEQKFGISQNPFVSFSYCTQKNDLAIEDYGRDNRSFVTFADGCRLFKRKLMDDFDTKTLEKHIIPYLKDCGEHLNTYIEKIQEHD